MRIDDDGSDRAQDIRAEEKRQQQLQQKRRSDEQTAFDRALLSRQGEGQSAKAQAQVRQSDARSAIQKAIQGQQDGLDGGLEHGEVEGRADAQREQELVGDQQKLARGASSRRDVDRRTGRVLEQGRGDDTQASSGAGERVHQDMRSDEARVGLRRADAEADKGRDERHDEHGQQGGSGSGKSSTGGTGQKRVEARKERDSSGGQGQGQGQGGNGAPPGAFRLPPAALMAPPPVARPKEAPQTSRLRELAKEIAEKIVKHARVGTNRMGLPEFQLELKSDILSGLKVKVSGRHGRIRALFASRDPQVLKQLRGEVESLRNALTARGLKVDALEIEEERA